MIGMLLGSVTGNVVTSLRAACLQEEPSRISRDTWTKYQSSIGRLQVPVLWNRIGIFMVQAVSWRGARYFVH
jgi:hypothetical protein